MVTFGSGNDRLLTLTWRTELTWFQRSLLARNQETLHSPCRLGKNLRNALEQETSFSDRDKNTLLLCSGTWQCSLYKNVSVSEVLPVVRVNTQHFAASRNGELVTACRGWLWNCDSPLQSVDGLDLELDALHCSDGSTQNSVVLYWVNTPCWVTRYSSWVNVCFRVELKKTARFCVAGETQKWRVQSTPPVRTKLNLYWVWGWTGVLLHDSFCLLNMLLFRLLCVLLCSKTFRFTFSKSSKQTGCLERRVSWSCDKTCRPQTPKLPKLRVAMDQYPTFGWT